MRGCRSRTHWCAAGSRAAPAPAAARPCAGAGGPAADPARYGRCGGRRSARTAPAAPPRAADGGAPPGFQVGVEPPDQGPRPLDRACSPRQNWPAPSETITVPGSSPCAWIVPRNAPSVAIRTGSGVTAPPARRHRHHGRARGGDAPRPTASCSTAASRSWRAWPGGTGCRCASPTRGWLCRRSRAHVRHDQVHPAALPGFRRGQGASRDPGADDHDVRGGKRSRANATACVSLPSMAAQRGGSWMGPARCRTARMATSAAAPSSIRSRCAGNSRRSGVRASTMT